MSAGLLQRVRRTGRRAVALVQESPRLSRKAAALARTGALGSERLIVFLVPGEEFLSGGILSIFALYRLTAELAPVHGARVLMCFYPGEGWRTERYTMFENDVTIYPFSMVLAACRRTRDLLLHVPEYAAAQVFERIGWERLAELRRARGLRVNILNQNNLLMPDEAVLARLRDTLPETTCTTAHVSYTTPEWRRRWGIPAHLLPAWTAPDDCPATAYESKRDLMIVSPDASPHRDAVLARLAEAFPALEIRVISGVPFEQYVPLERAAKWSLTFGEGLDAYFASLTLRGGVGFAVYNEQFFTPDYRGLRTVYPDHPTMLACIVDDLRSLDDKAEYEAYNARVRPLIAAVWSPDRTRRALERFYRGELTLP